MKIILLLLATFLFAPAAHIAMAQTGNNGNTLQEELDSLRTLFDSQTPPELMAIIDNAFVEMRESRITETALNVGDKAIDFTLENPAGKKVTLAEYLEKGPVILMWYRGGWCPYCNMTLHRMQEYLQAFKEAGANLIALTPETPDNSLTTAEKHALEFEVLTDTDNEVGKQYGVVYKVNKELVDYTKPFVDLSQYNGNDKNELPLSATYIIGQDGIIKYAFLDVDYKKRAEPSVLLQELETIK